MSTLENLLRARARDGSEEPALLAPGRRGMNYGELWKLVEQCAATIRGSGLDRRARIAVCLPNGAEAASVSLSVAACATCVPLNPGYQGGEFRFFLEDARATAVVVGKGESGPIRSVATELGLIVFEVEAVPGGPAGSFGFRWLEGGRNRSDGIAAKSAGDDWPDEAETALILHTSGTTGRPKIVPLAQANLVASARNIAAHLALTPQDRGLNVMPLFHIHGLVGSLLATLASGGSLACTPGFEGDVFFDWVAELDPTWYSAVPTIHQAVVANGAHYRRAAPGHRFRFVRSSSAALPPTTLSALESLFDAPAIEAYGMTEASHQMASNPLPPRVRKAGSVGVPAGVDIAILDDAGLELAAGQTGEIAVRGPGLTAGYENNPEANAKAFTRGWFRTGDQGRLDSDGYLFVSGRLKEIVNRGGEKVSPREIDEVLLEHPDVAQATAFAVPHPTLGEDLAAAVVLRVGRCPDEAMLREFLFERLAEFKVPSQIVFVDTIPVGPTGKIQRAGLHEKLLGALRKPFVSPTTDTEATVEEIVREVLHTGKLGIHDNFFALGGDSLRGTQVVGRVNARCSVNLPIVTLFRHPTVAALASAIERERELAAARVTELEAEIAGLSDEEVARMLEEMERSDSRDPGKSGVGH